MSHRKRGAPRGNHNALKHGYYSAAFKEQERRALSQLSAADLSSEIDVVRVALYRFMESLKQSAAPLDVQTQLAALRAVNLSAQSITGLVHAQVLLALLSDSQPPEQIHPLPPDPRLLPAASSASKPSESTPSPDGGEHDETQEITGSRENSQS